MALDDDLLAFVRVTTPAINDTARLVLADWLDEHPAYQGTPVRWHPVPKGFHTWWRCHVLPRHRGERLRLLPSRGRWSNYDVRNFLNNMDRVLPSSLDAPRHWNWFNGGGFSRVAGQSVVVGIPEGTGRESQVTAALLQDWFGCPVTYDRRGRHDGYAYRLVVWYTLPSEQPYSAADRLAIETERFIRQCLERAAGESEPLGLLYTLYSMWMNRAYCVPLPRPQFVQQVRLAYPEETRVRTLVGVRYAGEPERAPA